MSMLPKRPKSGFEDVEVKHDVLGDVKVPIDSRDIVAWERAHQGRPFAVEGAAVSITQMTELVYYAAKRANLNVGTLDEWFTQAALDIEGDEETAPSVRIPIKEEATATS